MSDWNKHFWSNQRCTSNDFFIAENDTSMRPFPFFGGNSFKGRLISESFSLWLKSPKHYTLQRRMKMLRRMIWLASFFWGLSQWEKTSEIKPPPEEPPSMPLLLCKPHSTSHSSPASSDSSSSDWGLADMACTDINNKMSILKPILTRSIENDGNLTPNFL